MSPECASVFARGTEKNVHIRHREPPSRELNMAREERAEAAWMEMRSHRHRKQGHDQIQI